MDRHGEGGLQQQLINKQLTPLQEIQVTETVGGIPLKSCCCGPWPRQGTKSSQVLNFEANSRDVYNHAGSYRAWIPETGFS